LRVQVFEFYVNLMHDILPLWEHSLYLARSGTLIAPIRSNKDVDLSELFALRIRILPDAAAAGSALLTARQDQYRGKRKRKFGFHALNLRNR
jgi:hypothetical protein